MKYVVKRHLTHNAVEYIPGSTVELTDEEAKPLVDGQVEAEKPAKQKEPVKHEESAPIVHPHVSAEEHKKHGR
jgi:hypothetical protein